MEYTAAFGESRASRRKNNACVLEEDSSTTLMHCKSDQDVLELLVALYGSVRLS